MWAPRPGVPSAPCGKIEFLFGIFIAVILLIVYGSFYPWQFEWRVLSANPLYLLFHSWDIAEGRRFYADLVANIAIYIPLGMSGYMAFRRFRLTWTRIAAPILVGTLLSASIEMTQLFTPTRECSSYDLMNNILGSVVGVAAGILFDRMAVSVVLTTKGGDRSALAMLFCLTAFRIFPVFPVTSLPALSAKMMAFGHSLPMDWVSMISAAATLFTAGQMIRKAHLRHMVECLMFFTILVPAQIFILSRQPFLADLLGAMAGWALFAAFGKSRLAIPVAAWVWAGVLAIRGLAPFHVSSMAQAFDWVPFEGFLQMDWQAGVLVLLEKLFFYGAAVWLMREAGLKWFSATGCACALLAAIEFIQTRLPGRTPEITDPILALLAGLLLRAFRPTQPATRVPAYTFSAKTPAAGRDS